VPTRITRRLIQSGDLQCGRKIDGAVRKHRILNITTYRAFERRHAPEKSGERVLVHNMLNQCSTSLSLLTKAFSRFARMPKTSADKPEGGRRDRRIRSLRKQMIGTGLDLFCEKGFANTTVTEIATAVGVSSRTFFRYFATKEDLVFPSEIHKHTRELLSGASPSVSTARALRDTLLAIGRLHDSRPQEARRRLRMVFETPTLTGRLHYEFTMLQKRVDSFANAREPNLSPQNAFLLSVRNSAAIAAYHVAVKKWAMEIKKGPFSPWLVAALGVMAD